MQKPSIPLSLIRDLRCRHCQNFVTCGPVYVVPDESILCGRCQSLAKDIYQNVSYEAIASIFRYPCHNWENHCSTPLAWNESLEHEEKCTYNGFCTMFWNHPKALIKGKREIPSGEIRQTPVPENLLEYIKCVQCECYLTCDPVYIQSNGKNICHRCVYANGIPPNCLRNIAYEMLSTILIFPCIYRNRGCPTRLRFGRALWQHETECSYGQTYQKITKNPNQKEKGVIKTHSGHYYGTITPNVVLFAPPSQKSEFELNKELLKSLKKQQERRFLRADEIGSQIEKMNSDDGSISGDSDKKNSYDTFSDRSSPVRSDYDAKSKQNIFQYQPVPVEPGYFSNNKGKPPQSPTIESHHNSLNLPQSNQNDPSPRVSRQNSYNKKKDYYHNQPKEQLNLKESFNNRQPLSSLDNNILAGHYPVFMYPQSPGVPKTPSSVQSSGAAPQTPSYNGAIPPAPPPYNGGLQNSFSFSSNNGGDYSNRVSRHESISSNKELIDELKTKLMRNKSAKPQNVPDSPYKECNNLEDILQTHDRITQ
ncbi:uncharacterized protein LOC108903943 [Anoplophora glabripennis]|uniref:uncharacterized protein LOC108903943 n=1 Tax=Anoplophora glabripennis TaxID=217634 RepID=UPI000873D5C2|nr:uncharacterized protein LOC108903943 [Anoplophora glabripennis]